MVGCGITWTRVVERLLLERKLEKMVQEYRLVLGLKVVRGGLLEMCVCSSNGFARHGRRRKEYG